MSRTFRTADEVASGLTLPVLAVIPPLLTANERRHLRQRRRLKLLLFVVIAALVAGGIALGWALFS